MKKSSIILTSFLLIFLTACEESKYDFSSNKDFYNSVIIQGEKEGMSKKDVNSLMEKLLKKESDEFMLKLIEKDIKNKTISDIKAGFKKNGFTSKTNKSLADGKKSIIKTTNKLLLLDLRSKSKRMIGAYDFSSEKAFLESIKKQAKIENVPEEEAEDILQEYLYLLAKANKDSIEQAKIKSIFLINLLKENIGNKSIREIEAQIDKM